MIRSSVVLPDPDGPSRATSSPELICSDTPPSAVKPSNCFTTSFTLMLMVRFSPKAQ